MVMRKQTEKASLYADATNDLWRQHTAMAAEKNKQDPPRRDERCRGRISCNKHHYEDPVELAHTESLGYDHRDIDTVIIGKSVFALLSVFTALVVVSYLTVAGLAKFQGLKQPYELGSS